MNYWDKRYLLFGNSGKGSKGKMREWKHRILDDYNIYDTNILDYGCGDLSFWDGYDFPSKYLGVDSSIVVIIKDKLTHPKINIKYLGNIGNKLKTFDNSICFDVLQHQLGRLELLKIIINLCLQTKERIFITNWVKSPFKNSNTDNKYQQYWSKDEYEDMFKIFFFYMEKDYFFDDNLTMLSVYRYGVKK